MFGPAINAPGFSRSKQQHSSQVITRKNAHGQRNLKRIQLPQHPLKLRCRLYPPQLIQNDRLAIRFQLRDRRLVVRQFQTITGSRFDNWILLQKTLPVRQENQNAISTDGLRHSITKAVEQIAQGRDRCQDLGGLTHGCAKIESM